MNIDKQISLADLNAKIAALISRPRDPTAAPLLSAAEVISAALSMFVPGPASLISPTGLGPRLIIRTLEKMDYEIVLKGRKK